MSRTGDAPRRAGWRHYALPGASGMAFVILAVTAGWGWWRALDWSLAAAIYVAAPCGLREASTLATLLFAGEPSLIWAGMIALALLVKRRALLALLVIALVLAIAPVELATKQLIAQPSPDALTRAVARPSCAPAAPGGAARGAQALPTALPSAAAGAVAYTTIGSLPSGYTARATFFGLLLWLALRARLPRVAPLAAWPIAGLLLALGLSRVVIAWHWPTDVLAGYLLGLTAGLTLQVADRWGLPAFGAMLRRGT